MKMKKDKTTSDDNSTKEMIKSLVIAVLLAFVFRSFLFEPFYIPSGSMKSTLLVGDYVFVSKYSYGYSKHSFPFGMPLFEGRKFETKPERGDVVVFKLPSNTNINYIKRLVGLPGDEIQVKDSILYINGQPLPRKQIENFHDFNDKHSQQISQYIETMPNGVSYHVLDQYTNGALDNTEIYKVPEKHYFFMGDNRDNSQDSRVLGAVGFVPEENLVGPARMIFFSSTAKLIEIWNWVSGLRGDRFLKNIAYEDVSE
jgi:signal peptidase I